ncbi:hypothetical protein GGI43DRAFT_220885 [Trichoderma evansii]
MAETFFVLVRKFGRQRQRKRTVRPLRLLRHAIPIATILRAYQSLIRWAVGQCRGYGGNLLSYYLPRGICVSLVLYCNVILNERERPWSVKGKDEASGHALSLLARPTTDYSVRHFPLFSIATPYRKTLGSNPATRSPHCLEEAVSERLLTPFIVCQTHTKSPWHLQHDFCTQRLADRLV